MRFFDYLQSFLLSFRFLLVLLPQPPVVKAEQIGIIHQQLHVFTTRIFLAFQQLVNPNKRLRAPGITFVDSSPKFSSGGPSPAGQTATAAVTNTSDRPRPRSNQVFGRLQH